MFDWKNFEFWYQCQTLSKKSLTLPRIFLAGLWQLQSMCHKVQFYEKKSFEKKMTFHGFRTSSEFSLAFCQKLFGEIVNTAFHVSIGLIEEKQLFDRSSFFLSMSDIDQKTLSHMSKFFRRVRDICVPRVHNNIFTENTPFWKTKEIFHHFRTLKETFLEFFRKISAGVATTLVYVSKGAFSGTFILSEKNMIFYHFHTLSGSFSKFCHKIVGVAVKIAFFVSIVTLWLKKNLFFSRFLSFDLTFGNWANNFWPFVENFRPGL